MIKNKTKEQNLGNTEFICLILRDKVLAAFLQYVLSADLNRITFYSLSPTLTGYKCLPLNCLALQSIKFLWGKKKNAYYGKLYMDVSPNFPLHSSIQIQHLSVNAFPCDYASSLLPLISKSALPFSYSSFLFTQPWAVFALKLPFSNVFSYLALNVHYFPHPWHSPPLLFLVLSAYYNAWWK